MATYVLTDLILEELLWRGPQTVEELSDHLKHSQPEIRSALASLYRDENKPQIIRYKDRKVARVS
jgi:predicted transcriptional regulator